MSDSHCERLSAFDALFLDLESQDVHMHVGAVALFALGDLATAEGGLDIEHIRASLEPLLRASPRFRQRLARVPLVDHPVWVDDDRFNAVYHVRHTALPAPGDERQLKRLAGRIFSQQLDRGKPLWELWFVEGLEGADRFAVIAKLHHCMLDGIAAVDLLTALADETEPRGAVQARWMARPAPGGAQLLAGELAHRAFAPARAARGMLAAARQPARMLDSVRETAEGLAANAREILAATEPTVLNAPLGPHRRFDWLRTDLASLLEVKQRLGVTANDVVLAAVAGALRRFFRERGTGVGKAPVRALVPVNVRSDGERGELGNRVSFLVVELPVQERTPRRRLARASEAARAAKRSHQALGAELLERLADWTFSSLLVRWARLGASAYHLVVTNMPGPREPLAILGARLLALYPLVPLFQRQTLGIAMVGYAGSLYWGFHADWDALPDLHALVEGVQSELEALAKEAAASEAVR